VPRRYHIALGTTAATLARHGVFNGFVDLDSKFYLDPRLLPKSRVPEFRGAAADIEGHFRNVIRLLKASRRGGDTFWKEAVSRLMFPEVSNTGLGYGATSTRGSAVGAKLAAEIAGTAKELIRAGITDPTIFELLGLFQDGIGADRVSDITVRILLPRIFAYTERVATRLGAPLTTVVIDRVEGRVPFDGQPSRWFLMLPERLLTQLPVAGDFDDISSVCAHNSDLRWHVNDRLQPMWRGELREMRKGDVRRFLLENTDILESIMEDYRGRSAEPYDFVNDPSTELLWDDVVKDVVKKNPLPLRLAADPTVASTAGPATTGEGENATGVVARICDRYKHLIENKGLFELLWGHDGRPRPERMAQRLFLGIAESYCEASNLDLSPEVNSGSGSVDFKISRGYHTRVLVELKRSGNGKIAHGYDQQLARYKVAEGTPDAFFLILDFGDRNADQIAAIQRKAKAAARKGQPHSRVVVVDARQRLSASRFEEFEL
jgi:hypothetical protein